MFGQVCMHFVSGRHVHDLNDINLSSNTVTKDKICFSRARLLFLLKPDMNNIKISVYLFFVVCGQNLLSE